MMTEHLKNLRIALEKGDIKSAFRALDAADKQAEEDQEELDFLEALRSAGVDNWEGYDFAWEIIRELQEEEEAKETP